MSRHPFVEAFGQLLVMLHDGEEVRLRRQLRERMSLSCAGAGRCWGGRTASNEDATAGHFVVKFSSGPRRRVLVHDLVAERRFGRELS